MDNLKMITRKTLRNFAGALGVSMLTLSPVWADDTEIFFGDFNNSNVAPNVMLIVDTSGSMNGNVDGTGMTRMQNVQVALRTLLNNLNGVNVGMMRFSNPGGPVLYPVSFIDKDVTLSESGDALVVQSIVDPDDDSQEFDDISVPKYVVGLGRERLEMSQMVWGGDSISRQVNSSNDDAEETVGSGCISTGSGSFEITHDDSSTDLQSAGLRFRGIDIPPTATITRAYITFVVLSVDNSVLSEVAITGEAKDTGSFPSDCSGNITNRTRTTASTAWDINGTLAAEDFIDTPDISPVIQEIITDPSWLGSAEEDDMVILFDLRSGSTANGQYDFYTWDGDTGKAPVLNVEYYVGSPPDLYKADTGLRFQNINVPKGATITSAKIDFVAAAPSTGAASIEIRGEASDDSAPITPTDLFTIPPWLPLADISSRTPTTASVAWDNIPAWTTANEVHSTPDLSAVVQEIVNRTNWCGGNDMGFYLTGTGLRSAYAREANNGLQPQLTIEYDPDSVVAGASCGQAEISKGITSSIGDIEDDGDILSSGNVLDFESGNDIGLRFSGMNIPKDAVISSAYIQLTSNNGDSSNATIAIKAEQSDDSAVFTTNSNTLSSRSWSSAVNWNITNSWSAGESYNSVDITSLVQAIVNRSGWDTGNAIAFLLDHTSGSNRRGITYDNNPVQAPRLVVNFQDDGSYSGEVRLVRDELLEVVDSLNTAGYTPIQDTLYEAALYFTGGEVDYGSYRGGPNDSGPHHYTRVSAADSMVDTTYTINRPTGCTEDNLGADACEGETISGLGGENATYDSPINDWCQTNNHVILLTDGQANRPHSETKIEDFIGDSYSCDDTGVNSSEICVTDLAKYLYENDQSDLKENQRITTHTIGFNFSSTWLADVAAAGGGQYREATQAADLVAEIQQILTAVLKTNTSFVAPVAAINQFNRLNHRNEIYFAVFRPDEKPSWPGNLKRYRLRSTDNVVIDYSAADEADANVAVNPDTGFFSDNAESAWTPTPQAPDGKQVEVGGAGSVMPAYDARKLYTHYSGTTSDTLSNVVNVVSTTNSNLTKAMFDAGSLTDAEFNEHIEWVLGKDTEDEDSDGVTAENRYIVADPLHSKPVAITYGGTEESPDITIFLGSNAGMIHAINASTGVEQFAYMPEEMLPLQKTLRTNDGTEAHPYGIDGSITPWVKDVDADGVIEPGDGDFVRLYFGMRRGGNKYYALDVSNRNSPKMLWQIEGGSGDYAELGQTWAQPTVGRIKVGTEIKDVLFFSGGYDENQDSATSRQTDSIGRAIFIADATDGSLIWSGGNGGSFTEDFDDMLYSIPADLSVVVVQDEDKFDDIIFVGDMGGQIWRFDINNGAALDDLVTGGVIANLGGNPVAQNRRFYHSPDVALIKNPSGNPAQLMTVTMGSGFHAHPLSTGTDDRFYMIEQTDIYAAPTSYVKLTHANLYDATDNEVGEGVSGAEAALAAKSGWYFDMPNAGEKVLSTPLTFRNTVTFTTYEPSPEVAIRRCAPAAGVSRFYQVRVEDASPVNYWDDVDGLTEDDRSTFLQSASIIDEPVIVCTGTGCDLFAGAEQPDVDTGNTSRIVKTFWRRDN